MLESMGSTLLGITNYRMEKHCLTCYFVFIMACIGCIDQTELPFSADDIERNLVVDGKITPGVGPFQLKLRQIADFARDSLVALNSAHVLIRDDQGNQSEYRFVGEGLYQLDEGQFEGVVGRAYAIEIRVEDRIYTSKAQVIPPLIPVDSFYTKFATEIIPQNPPNSIPRDIIKLFVDTQWPDLSEGPYLRWELSEDFVLHEFVPPDLPLKVANSCYYNRVINPQTINILDGEIVTNNRWEQNLIGIRKVDWTFFYRHYFNVSQISTTREAHDYWARARQIINQVGSIFDIPPAGLQGNVFRPDNPEELVLGFFEAASIDTAHTVLFKADFPYQVEGLCPSVFYYQLFRPTLPEACCACGILEGANPVPPYYWEED